MSVTLPARHNIDTFTDTFIRRVFRWLQDGELADLTGWTARLRIGRHGQLFAEVDDAVTLGGVDGTVSMEIPAGTLTEVGTYSYVVDLIDPDSGVVRFVTGVLRASEVFP